MHLQRVQAQRQALHGLPIRAYGHALPCRPDFLLLQPRVFQIPQTDTENKKDLKSYNNI